MTSPASPVPVQLLNRNIVIAGGVVLLHVAALWALQTGLLRRAVEIVVPVEVLAQIIDPPMPKIEPQPPEPPVPAKQPVPRQIKPTQPPLPMAIADPTPAPSSVTAVAAPQPAPAPIAAPVAATPAPARVELPSSDADYLQNPKPPYPLLSKRLGEQGKVVVRVFIDVNGVASRPEIRQSSGYDRLDEAALNTVIKWRYVPGKRGGVAEAMWFNVPINFVLE